MILTWLNIGKQDMPNAVFKELLKEISNVRLN